MITNWIFDEVSKLKTYTDALMIVMKKKYLQNRFQKTIIHLEKEREHTIGIRVQLLRPAPEHTRTFFLEVCTLRNSQWEPANLQHPSFLLLLCCSGTKTGHVSANYSARLICGNWERRQLQIFPPPRRIDHIMSLFLLLNRMTSRAIERGMRWIPRALKYVKNADLRL